MAAIYSTQFYAGPMPSASQITVYTIPNPSIAIIRDITICAQSTALEVVIVGNPGSGAELCSIPSLALRNTFHQECRIVLPSEQEISLYNEVASVAGTCIISGYLLSP